MRTNPITDILESVRLRDQTNSFEAVISGLTCEIGRVERLTDLTPDQLERLWSATSRLSKAALAKGKNDE